MPHPQRPQLTLPVRVDPRGLLGPTPKQARGPHWRTVRAGWFVPAAVDGADPHQRVLEAAAGLPQGCGVTGWAALAWHGGRWFDGSGVDGAARPVTLAVGPRNVRPVPGVAVSKEQLPPDDLEVVDGVRVTTAVRSVLFEVRYAAELRQAVTVVDCASYSDLVSVAEVRDAVATLGPWTGIEQARQAVLLAEENAWSPAEVDLRLLCVLEAGLTGVRSNVPVFDLAGRHLGTPDLLDPGTGLLIEYDGAVHLTSSVRRGDLQRTRRFRDVGLHPVVVVSSDLAKRSATAELLRSEAGRASARAHADRRWTLEAPRWWTRTETVESRRRLTAADAERLLAHRRAA